MPLVAISVALAIAVVQVADVSSSLLLLAVPAVVVAGFVVSQGPLACLGALVLLDVLGLYQDTFGLGPVTLRSIDVFWAGLVVWMVVVRRRDGVQPGRNVGQRALAVCLVALGVSLLPVFVRVPGLTTGPFVAWLRLVQTFSLVWLVPYGVRRREDAELVVGVLQLALVAELVRAMVVAIASGEIGERLAGGNSPNTEGLLAALLIVAALHAPVPKRGGVRLTYLLVGLGGLLMARSLGATAALIGVLAIFGLGRRVRVPERSSLLVPVRLLLLVLVGVMLAGTFRAENLPTSSNFKQSTTVHRAVLATAGIELFAGSPLVGIGWQRSPDVIASPSLNDKLERTFGDEINPEFLPEKNPTGVHNLYIQVLAEAGIVGMLALLGFLLLCARGIRDALRDLRGVPALHDLVRACLAMLVVLAIWWNDNALYGAQPETVIAATLLGVIAATTFASRTRPAHVDEAPGPRASIPRGPRLT